MTLLPGATLGPYRIIEQVGRGGMATVYKAYQAALSRHVAIKVLPAHLAADEGFRERFRAEAVTVGKLRHPNILSVFDFGEEDGVHYLVSELIDGGTLADQLGKPLPPEYVVAVLGPIAAALDYAHARDVVHRDVKPSNVLLTREGVPVLSDFGLARMVGSLPRLTRTGAMVGTPEYMAPEQALGESAGEAADRYALAVIAYEMLTGGVPYTADTPLATLLAHLHRPLPLPRERNPQLPRDVEAVLLKGLAKRPEDRYARARDLTRALERAAVAASATSALEQGDKGGNAPLAPAALAAPAAGVGPSKRRAARVGAAAAALIAAALVATAVLTRALGAGFPFSPAAPSPTSPASELDASKGPLIWQAKLDGTGADLRLPRNIEGDPAGTDIRFRPGAIDLVVLRPGSGTGAALNLPSLRSYVGELDLSVSSDSDASFIWGLRRTPPRGEPAELLLVHADASASLELIYEDPPQIHRSLTSQIPIARAPSGAAFTVDAVVAPSGVTLYLDGRRVAAASDAGIGGESIPDVGIFGRAGAVHILGARFYQLRTAGALGDPARPGT